VGDWPALGPNEAEVKISDELIWRQMTSFYWDEEKRQPSSHAFGPAPIDKRMASFTRAFFVTAQEARDWHQENAASPSFSVWALATVETDDVDVRVVDDSNAPLEPGAKRPPGHCYLDYRGVSKPEERTIRAVLLRHALARGEIATTDSGFVPVEERDEAA
jgi:hypothetical protein